MFKVIAEPKVKWPVRVDYGGAGSEQLAEPFEVTFAIIPTSEALNLAERDVRTLLRRVVAGFDPIDIDGQTVEFSPAALEQLLDRPRERQALWGAYQKASRGEREGN